MLVAQQGFDYATALNQMGSRGTGIVTEPFTCFRVTKSDEYNKDSGCGLLLTIQTLSLIFR